MGTFKDSLKKWFYNTGTSAGELSSRIPVLDGAGNPIGSNTVQNIANVMQQGIENRLSALEELAEISVTPSETVDIENNPSGITSGSEKIPTANAISGALDAVKASMDDGVYDVSAKNSDADFDSLQALLSSQNIDTLIPVSSRKGGMSIRFKTNVGTQESPTYSYVQYRLMSPSWSTIVDNWQGVDAEPMAGSRNLVESGGVSGITSKLATATGEVDDIPFVLGGYEGAISGNALQYTERENRIRIELPGDKVNYISTKTGYKMVSCFFEDRIPTNKRGGAVTSKINHINLEEKRNTVSGFNPNKVIIVFIPDDDSSMAGITSLDDIIDTIVYSNKNINGLSGDIDELSDVVYSNTSAVYITGEHSYTDKSVTFNEGSSIFIKDLKTGSINTVKEFSEDATYTFTATYRCLIYDSTETEENQIKLVTNNNVKSTDILLLIVGGNSIKITGGELYYDYFNDIFLNICKKFVYTTGDVIYTNNSIEFKANSALVYKNYNKENIVTITFSEDTIFTITNLTRCIVLRDNQIVVTNNTNTLSTDLVLLVSSTAKDDFVAGALYTEYLNKKIDSVNDKCYATINEPLLSSKKITNEGLVENATTSTNLTLYYDVSNMVGTEVELHGVLFATTGAYCWWSILDDEDNVLSKSDVSDGNRKVLDETVTIPLNAAKLYVQGTQQTNELPLMKALVNVLINNGTDHNEKVSKKTFALDFCSLSSSTGKVATASAYTNCANKHTIDYIKVHKTITINGLNGLKTAFRVFFFDENFSVISNDAYQDSTDGLFSVGVNIPDGAEWFRLSFHLSNSDYNTSPAPIFYSKNYIEISSEWDGNDTMKEPYQEYTPFLYSVKVNVPYKIADNPSSITKPLFSFDEGLLHLPLTYTPNGTPTPVIFYIHGDAERYTIGESTFSGHMKMQQCWSDAGFAQIDLDLIPSCYNNSTTASTGGTRDDFECITAAWEWIINHFNVDKSGFYLIGRSRGGQCVLEVLGKGGATKLPIIAAISMAGANSIFEYSVHSVANEAEWQLWCDSHGLPIEGRPRWSDSQEYSTSKSFLNDEDCYNFVVDNFNLWWRKALTGWGLLTKNVEGITPKNYFDNISYQLGLKNNSMGTSNDIETFYLKMITTMEAKSPVPLRLDWCVGDTIQSREYFTSPHSYASAFAEILLNTPSSLTEYRRWDGVDETNPYNETNPHYAENMIFYDGDVKLPNGAITQNPSKVTLEWLIWCMGHDQRYQTLNYSLPWTS